MQAKPAFQHLVLWAGQLPEDIDYSPALAYFEDKQLHFAYGDTDPFISPERMAFLRKVIADSGLTFAEFSFSGAHEVEANALISWKENFI